MSGWIISITGIALLTILCDIIVPDGSTKKYVQTVVGVVVSLVLVLPAVTFFQNFSAEEVYYENKILPQQQYLDTVEIQKQQVLQREIEALLQYHDIDDYSLEINEDVFYLKVFCSQEKYLKLSRSLNAISDNITIVWRDSSG